MHQLRRFFRSLPLTLQTAVTPPGCWMCAASLDDSHRHVTLVAVEIKRLQVEVGINTACTAKPLPCSASYLHEYEVMGAMHSSHSVTRVVKFSTRAL